MPRPLRIEYDGAWYHVMNRGVNHQNIFNKNVHRELFLSLLNEISQRFYIEIHAYCLMDNHYHLLVHTPKGNLSRAMRHLNGVYTQKYNRLENKDGPLFRGRFKSIVIEANNYLLSLSRYIHLNPVTAKLCQDPRQYPWSSVSFYIDPQITSSWLKTNYILKEMKIKNPSSEYLEFLLEGIDTKIQNFFNKNPTLAILGSKEFIKDHIEKISQPHRIAYSSDITRINKQLSPENIFDEVMLYFKIDKTTLTAKTPGTINYAKIIAIYLCCQHCHISHQKIAIHFNLQAVSIGAIFKRCNEIKVCNEIFKNQLEKIEEKLIEN